MLLCRWPGDVFPDMRIVPKCRVNGTLKPFKVTQHGLSVMASSSSSLLEAVSGSQLDRIPEIIHPRIRRSRSALLEDVKKGSPQFWVRACHRITEP